MMQFLKVSFTHTFAHRFYLKPESKKNLAYRYEYENKIAKIMSL